MITLPAAAPLPHATAGGAQRSEIFEATLVAIAPLVATRCERRWPQPTPGWTPSAKRASCSLVHPNVPWMRRGCMHRHQRNHGEGSNQALALHIHGLDVPQRGDVGASVTVEEEQICIEPWGQPPRPFRDCAYLGGDGGGRS
jgi:hypothetical protein